MGISLSQSNLTIRMKWNNEYAGALENYSNAIQLQATYYLEDNNIFSESFKITYIVFCIKDHIQNSEKLRTVFKPIWSRLF